MDSIVSSPAQRGSFSNLVKFLLLLRKIGKISRQIHEFNPWQAGAFLAQ